MNKKSSVKPPAKGHDWVQYYGYDWYPRITGLSDHFNHFRCSKCSSTCTIPNEMNKTNKRGWIYKPHEAGCGGCKSLSMNEALS